MIFVPCTQDTYPGRGSVFDYKKYGKIFFTLIETAVDLELSKVNPENCTFIIFEKLSRNLHSPIGGNMTKINIVVLKNKRFSIDKTKKLQKLFSRCYQSHSRVSLKISTAIKIEFP